MPFAFNSIQTDPEIARDVKGGSERKQVQRMRGSIFFFSNSDNINNSNQIATISRVGGLPHLWPIVKSYVGEKSPVCDN